MYTTVMFAPQIQLPTTLLLKTVQVHRHGIYWHEIPTKCKNYRDSEVHIGRFTHRHADNAAIFTGLLFPLRKEKMDRHTIKNRTIQDIPCLYYL